MRFEPLDKWLYHRRSYYADSLLMGEFRETIKAKATCFWRGHVPSGEWRYPDEPLGCDRCYATIQDGDRLEVIHQTTNWIPDHSIKAPIGGTFYKQEDADRAVHSAERARELRDLARHHNSDAHPMNRHRTARVIRDWIHDQPFSLCNASADECPDWPMAYELADLIESAEAHATVGVEPALHGENGPNSRDAT